MAKQIVNVGTSANDGTGDTLRVSQQKANNNFDDLYDYGGLNITVNNPVTLTETTLDTALSNLVGSGGGSVNSVTGPTVDNTDPANPIVNLPSLQQVTSKLLDGDGYAETTDGIKTIDLKAGGFGAGDSFYGFEYSDSNDGFPDLRYIPFYGLEHKSQGSPKVAYFAYTEVTAIDYSDKKATAIISDGLYFRDDNTGKGILLKQPASIVGTDKIVQWRDRGGEPAFVDELPTADDLGAEKLVNKGVANGYVPLNSSTKIDLTYIPDSLLGQMIYGGLFNATTAVAILTTNAKTRLGTVSSTIILTNDTTAITGYLANEGIYYISSFAGTFAGLSIDVGDWLLSIGTGWSKIDNTDAISSFNSRTGAITLIDSDIATVIHGATSKPVIIDADEIGGTNSVTSFSLIKFTALNLYTYIKAKTDLVYASISSVGVDISVALASFKISNFLDATSSIQTQLNNRTNIVIKDATVSSTVTGTIVETVLKTYTIPANTFSASDIMNIQMFKGIKTGSGADGIQRIRINTSPTLVGAVEIARLSGSSNLYRNMKRSFTLDGGNLIGYPFTISAVTDMVSDSATLSSTPYNTANVLYVMTTIELISSANSFYQREFLMTR